jgi:hypothetical protein
MIETVLSPYMDGADQFFLVVSTLLLLLIVVGIVISVL